MFRSPNAMINSSGDGLSIELTLDITNANLLMGAGGRHEKERTIDGWGRYRIGYRDNHNVFWI